jgi:protein involved in polysaccharide export with SLBB domain
MWQTPGCRLQRLTGLAMWVVIAAVSDGGCASRPAADSEIGKPGFYYVAGHVESPGVYQMHHTSLGVREALVAARLTSGGGSLPVTLFRLTDGTTETMPLGDLPGGGDSGPVVRPGDVIQVGSPPWGGLGDATTRP